MATVTAGVGVEKAVAAGHGTGVICSVNLGPSERAGLVEGFLVDGSDSRRGRGIVAINPDDGVASLTDDGSGLLSLNGNRLDLVASTAARGWLSVTFTPDYSF